MRSILPITQKENDHYFLCFCSYVCLINNKKLNLPNILLLLLKNLIYREIFKEMLSVDTDFEIVQTFLKYDPTICTSKYLSKYLNSKRKSYII